MDRLSVAEAARRMGITEGAVRKRIARDTLPHERDREGRLWVRLPDQGAAGQDAGQPVGQDTSDAEQALVEELRDRVRYLERQVEEERDARRRADMLLARLMDRVPELERPEAAEETPGEPERAPGGQDTGQDAPAAQEAPQPRSWWRRYFGF